jgi:hypothetical protein
MDGFDTSGFEVGRVYVVTDALAHYLVRAGYASDVVSGMLDTPVERGRDQPT